MKKYEFDQCDSDHTLFIKLKGDKLTVLIIYVDDMIIAKNDREKMHRLEEKLSQEFEMKNLGRLEYFLEIKIMRSKEGIFLSQKNYVFDFLKELGMLECKPIDNSMVPNTKFEVKPDQIPKNMKRYQILVGRLIYLSHTRPDITYVVGVASQFMHSSSKEHMDMVIRIVKYLNGSTGRGILFKFHGHIDIMGYSYVDWAESNTDKRSISGYFTFVEGNLVTWKRKKQNIVALSSVEVEFRAMSKGICELLWLRKLLKELGYPTCKEINLLCDNKAAIAIAQNSIQHDRTKHIEIDQHFIKKNLETKTINFPFMKFGQQLADILTKAVPSKQVIS
jgi:Reverse transcriptase (RNA-dependent DNA polymerase)